MISARREGASIPVLAAQRDVVATAADPIIVDDGRSADSIRCRGGTKRTPCQQLVDSGGVGQKGEDSSKRRTLMGISIQPGNDEVSAEGGSSSGAESDEVHRIKHVHLIKKKDISLIE